MNTIIIKRLNTKLYVFKGQVYQSLDPIDTICQEFFKGQPVQITDADKHEKAFWGFSIKDGTATII